MFLDTKKIKVIFIKNYKYIYREFFSSFIFSLIFSFIIHYCLITILLWKFSCKQKFIAANISNVVVFALYDVDSFSHDSFSQQNKSNIMNAMHKNQESTFKTHCDKTKKNLKKFKNMSEINNKISSSSSTQKKTHDNCSSTDFIAMPQIDEHEAYNNTMQATIPCIIYRVYPEYPNRAKALGIEGKLIVMYDVNNMGRVENIRILSAIPVGMFENSVRSAMRRWIYESNKSRRGLTIIFKFYFSSVEILDTSKKLNK